MASRGIDESTMLEPMDVANDVDEGWSFKLGPGLGTGDEVSTVTWPPIIALPPPPPPLSTSSCEGCRSGDIFFPFRFFVFSRLLVALLRFSII